MGERSINGNVSSLEPRHVRIRVQLILLVVAQRRLSYLHRDASIMDDSADNKQKSKLDWQSDEASGSHDDLGKGLKTPDSPAHVEAPPPRAILLEQASKFVEDDEIKDAPAERKIAFLRSKGLTDEEAYRLLELPCDNAKAEMPKETGPEQAVCFAQRIYSTLNLTSV